MSDGVCGPSNALQDLRKNASVDRTLQQDRLTARQPQGQGFRSQTPQDGILDPEFAAFEAGYDHTLLPPPEYAAHHSAHHSAQYHAPAQRPVAAPPSANWANDFQRLNIAGPAQPQMQGPPIAQAQPQAQGGWHEEFMRQQTRSQQASAHLQNPQITNRGYQPTFGPRANYPMGNPFALQRQASQAAPVNQTAPVQQYDEAAFAAAFDKAQADMESQETETAQSTEQQLNEEELAKMPETPLTDEHFESVAPVHEQRIGSDNIPGGSQNTVHSADALAHTAGELLEGISHEQSDKFQQSNFLALMRRIRDREVEVQGDEFREVGHNT
ncbi:hypothetical protein N7493_007097 [Penicillium malachiteum]|uniref:Peroxin 20 n=1 Tax=Penicillium malachiteum TaxID=1324776 RepID=A0AAD6HIN7_9EURO|nr:hypothetical protein N7493_007097 [Penicillium malachiteum]